MHPVTNTAASVPNRLCARPAPVLLTLGAGAYIVGHDRGRGGRAYAHKDQEARLSADRPPPAGSRSCENFSIEQLEFPTFERNYGFAMEQFITWYCSEPRLALNRTVVLRFRLHYLESLGLASGTINQRLAAVRRLAYEAADSGLLSPELAAGIRRVKGVKQLGCRTGNWLNREQARLLLEESNGEGLRSIRDVAMMSILLGCGLRRAELSALRKEDIQIDKVTGLSLTLSARATTSGPYPCQSG